MPKVTLILYQEKRRSPVWDWLQSLHKKIREKAELRMERLAYLGHELRRPEADYLRDGIYELRWRHQFTHYRLLYFFHGREIVVLTEGLTKQGEVPETSIELAIIRKKRFEENPQKHAFYGELK